MAFKMKGNPMKRNFGVGKEAPYFTKQKNTNINRGDDKGNPTAAFQKSAMKHDRGSYEKGLPDHLANKFHKEEVDGHRHDAAGNKLVIVGKSKKAPTKFVGKTIKKIKDKRAAKRAEKEGKGNLATAVSTAIKMKKPSPVKNKPDSSKTKVKYKDGVVDEKYYYDKDGNYLGKATGLAGSTEESRKALLESKKKG